MTKLVIEVTGARPEAHAAVPTLVLEATASELTGSLVHALALRCQVRIEPQRRRYDRDEELRLYELFGPTSHWGESLRPFLWTHVSTVTGGFAGQTTIELPIACSYDFEVAGSKYMHALDDGEIPLLLLFSGTVFTRGEAGFAAEPLPWHLEARYRLAVSCWRAVMDMYFPNSGWVRLDRATLDRLQNFKARRALPSWDLAVEQLLKEAGEAE